MGLPVPQDPPAGRASGTPSGASAAASPAAAPWPAASRAAAAKSPVYGLTLAQAQAVQRFTVSYLSHSVGRDKINRFVQFFAKWLGYQLARGATDPKALPSTAVLKLQRLEKAVASARKLMRIGRPIEFLQNAQNALAVDDPLLRTTGVVRGVAQAVWILFDSAQWLHTTGLVAWRRPAAVAQRGARAWLLALLMAVVEGVHRLAANATQLAYLMQAADAAGRNSPASTASPPRPVGAPVASAASAAAPASASASAPAPALAMAPEAAAASTAAAAKPSPSLRRRAQVGIMGSARIVATPEFAHVKPRITALLAQRRQLRLQLVQDLVDLVIPATGAGYLAASAGTVGLAGTITSLMGGYTLATKLAK